MNLSIAMVTTASESATSGIINQPPCVSSDRKLIPVFGLGCDSADAGGAVCGGTNSGASKGVNTVALTVDSVVAMLEIIRNVRIPNMTAEVNR